ncbi:hypothetical protein QBC47DRAFT_9215 [Echria macrotheca]|uniref:Uncharacterized protein n=1 Tax=Echria macrotheca TaxID=438768 RepID=A0AAJ0BLN3_9PEZI|nr:hypothetical protein QBC47DRAFT_9215 [Echria macrotheca]
MIGYLASLRKAVQRHVERSTFAAPPRIGPCLSSRVLPTRRSTKDDEKGRLRRVGRLEGANVNSLSTERFLAVWIPSFDLDCCGEAFEFDTALSAQQGDTAPRTSRKRRHAGSRRSADGNHEFMDRWNTELMLRLTYPIMISGVGHRAWSTDSCVIYAFAERHCGPVHLSREYNGLGDLWYVDRRCEYRRGDRDDRRTSVGNASTPILSNMEDP